MATAYSKRELRRMKQFFHGVQGQINSRTKKFEKKHGLETGSRGRIRYDELMEAFLSADGRCFYCKDVVAIMQRSYGKTVKRLSFDHYLSLGMGGTSTIDNLVVSCQFCNQEKSLSER